MEANLASVTAIYRYQSMCHFQRTHNLPLTHPSVTRLIADTTHRPNAKHLLKPEKYAHTYRIAELEIDPYYTNTIVPHLITQHSKIQKPAPPSLLLVAQHLASDLTKPTLKQLLMWDTHHEWMHDTRHRTTAPLRTSDCLPILIKPLFLYHEDLPLATLRIKLRADRVNTQKRLNFIKNAKDAPSPLCTFPSCNPTQGPLLPAPTLAMDTVPHILLHCHRHDVERAALILSLAASHYSLPLTVAFLTGTTSLSLHPRIPQVKRLLALTASFLQSIVATRDNDPALTPLLIDNPG
jgi:hypothetical protein